MEFTPFFYVCTLVCTMYVCIACNVKDLGVYDDPVSGYRYSTKL